MKIIKIYTAHTRAQRNHKAEWACRKLIERALQNYISEQIGIIKSLDQKYVSKNAHDLHREQKEGGHILAWESVPR